MSSRDDLVKVVLANDGGTCHGFGKMHCFNDPAAKWDGRRCNECMDWAEHILRSVEEPIRADERERNKAEVNGTAKWCREDERATLRARVEALPGWQHGDAVLREDVLALLEGNSDA